MRISDCDLTVGQYQVGILVTDMARAYVADNVIRVAGQPFSASVADWMKWPALRGSIRDQIMRAPQFVVAAPAAGAAPVAPAALAAAAPAAAAAAARPAGAAPVVSVTRRHGVPVTIALPGGTNQLTFSTASAVAAAVTSVLQRNPAKAGVSGQAVIEHARSLIDRALLSNPAIIAGAALLRWAGTVIASNPVTFEQGIVVAGRTAPDVRILGNTIIGAVQGVHVGLRHVGMARGTHDTAGRVMIHGNKLDIRLPAVGLRDRHAIFVGSAASLLIDNNYATMTAAASVAAEAVRVFGVLGRQVILRENHLEGFTIGFIFHPLNNPADKTVNQWMVVDNVASNTSPVVQVPTAFAGKVNVSNNLA